MPYGGSGSLAFSLRYLTPLDFPRHRSGVKQGGEVDRIAEQFFFSPDPKPVATSLEAFMMHMDYGVVH